MSVDPLAETWPYIPTGDGRTVRQRDPPPAAVEYEFDSSLKTPCWKDGYKYFYAVKEPDGPTKMREEHPYAKDLLPVYQAVENLYEGPARILRQTKATTILKHFIFATNQLRYQEPSFESFVRPFSLEVIEDLRQRLRRLRSPPVDESIINNLRIIQETMTHVFARMKGDLMSNQ